MSESRDNLFVLAGDIGGTKTNMGLFSMSGAGLLNIYNWLVAREKQDPPDWLKEMFKNMDPVRVISETALANKDPGCVKALDRFVSIFGAVAGNVAAVIKTWSSGPGFFTPF